MKNKTKSQQFADITPTIEETLVQHPYFHYLSKHAKTIGYAAILITALLFLIYRFSASRSDEQKLDYMRAYREFRIVEGNGGTDSQNTENQQQALNNLSAILERRPSLQAKYDGQLAQRLLILDMPDDALPFAKRVMTRTNGELPLFHRFSQTSLQIAQGKVEEALEQAKALRDVMLESEETKAFSNTLFAFNLIRIASLEQKIGSPQAERVAWEELLAYQDIAPKAFQQISESLNLGSMSLEQYIDYRLMETAKEKKLQIDH